MSKVFKLWPEPKDGRPYGPTPKQRLLFIESLPEVDTWVNASTGQPCEPDDPSALNLKRPHYHPVDVVLYIGGARCFAKGTPVLMFDGSIKPVEEVVPGDLVMGPDSQSRLVTSLARGTEPMYRIIPDKGEPWECNESHNLSLWFKRSCRGKIIERIDTITVGNYLASSNFYKRKSHLYKVPVEFKEQELELDPYFLGYWLGDGDSANTGITTMDPEVVEYIKNYAVSLNMDIREREMVNNKASRYFITNHNKFNKLYNLLSSFNVINNKHIPQKFLINSKENRLQLLAGLLDSDGCLIKHTNLNFIFVNKNEKLARQVSFLAASLGFRSTVNQAVWKKNGKLGTYFRVYINGNNLDEIPCKIERKKAPRRFSKYNYLATGFKVEPIGEGEFFGFSLAGEDSRFLLADFTVVENSGKTVASAARGIQYLLDNKKATAVVGAENFPLLKRTLLNEWKNRFSQVTPWDHLKLKDRLILKKPTQNDKIVNFANGSQAHFIHFNDPEIIRGIDADIITFEEACLLKDKDAFRELLLRLSGRKGPIRQLILTTNPEATGGWISDEFKLKQKPRADGTKPPIIDPCLCHLCQDCLNNNRGRVEYLNEDGDKSVLKGSKCPDCGEVKESDCPGNQIFWRVIQTATSDNKHTPQDLTQTMLRSMDKRSAEIFVKGQLDVELRESYVYRAFEFSRNVFDEDEELDPELPLFWSMDFNFDPQCSVVCQEVVDEEGNFLVKVLDEIVLWNSLPEHAAEEFCERYKIYAETGGQVYIYGDPAGLYNTGQGLLQSYYDKVVGVLKKNNFNVKVMMRRPDPEAQTKFGTKEKLQIPVTERIEAVNTMLCNGEGEVRLKFNPACGNVIKSLAELQFTEDGRSINKAVDRKAGRSSNKNTPQLMTHPTDALGYYIYKRFPLIKNKKGIVFFQIPGDSVTELKDGKVTLKDRKEENIPDWKRKKIEDRKKKREERKKQRDRKKPPFGDDLWGFYFPF